VGTKKLSIYEKPLVLEYANPFVADIGAQH
jgi:hypothetical protein